VRAITGWMDKGQEGERDRLEVMDLLSWRLLPTL